MKPRVAVIGGGVAGVSAAYHSMDRTDVTLFEAEPRLGGHANTIEVEDDGRLLGLDTAFIVYNEPHYPTLTRFFDDLDVPTQDHPGRFCFFDADSRTSYVSEDFDLAEEQVRELYPEDFHELWSESRRFLSEAPRHFVRKQAEIPLGEYLDRHGYSENFRYGFIVLIATAAWSVPADRIWDMPAATVIAFFFAHGNEGLGGRTAPWRTVTGGSVTYLRAAQERMAAAGVDIRTAAPVLGVREEAEAVHVRTASGTESFDHVIMATHADDTMRLLETPSPRQRILEEIGYQPTRATLHTDSSVLPVPRERWRSWNYGRVRTERGQDSWVVYYLNDLQLLSSETDYFLTLDSGVPIREESIIADLSYRHPVITTEVRRMQPEIRALNSAGSRVGFAGSYLHSRKMGVDIIGMHESAFDSGAAAAEAMFEHIHGTAPHSS